MTVSADSLKVNRLVPGLIEQTGRGLKDKTTPPVEGEKFQDLFANMLNSVNRLQTESADIQNAFLNGEPVELHQVMIKAEEAGVATDLLLEIRNKLISAYNELMRMPV